MSISPEQIRELVGFLAIGRTWSWTEMVNRRDAADEVLRYMAQLGIIEQKKQRYRRDVYICGGMIFDQNDDTIRPVPEKSPPETTGVE